MTQIVPSDWGWFSSLTLQIICAGYPTLLTMMTYPLQISENMSNCGIYNFFGQSIIDMKFHA